MTILASLALATGCIVGDVPDPTTTGTPNPNGGAGGSNAGKAEFDKSIAPLVGGCAGASCHSGVNTDPLKFLGTGDPSEYYPSIVSYAQVHGDWNIANASLVTKLDIAAATGNHFGKPPWTADEKSKIQAWFAIEAANIGDVPPNTTPGRVDSRTLLAEWSGCMNLEIWNTAKMGLWRNKGTNAGPCVNCHNDGQFLINIAPNSDTMFQMNRMEYFITGFFTVKIDPALNTGEVVPAYDKLVRVGSGDTGSRHPTFNTDIQNDQYFKYLTAFYEQTKAAKAAVPSACGPAGFPVTATPTPAPAQ